MLSIFRHRGLKLTVEVLSIAFAGFLVLALVMIWRLSQGPINIGFLSYKLERILGDSERGINVTVDRTVLTWHKEQQSLQLEVEGASFKSDDNPERPFLVLKRIGFNLNITDLLIGKIRPTRILVYGPSLELVRDKNNKLTFAFGDNPIDTPAAEKSRPIEQLKNRLDVGGPLSKLQEFAIFDANIRLDDMVLERTWNIPQVNIVFDMEDTRLVGQAEFTANITDKPTDFNVDVVIDLIDESGQLQFSFNNLNLSGASELGPRFEKMRMIDLPMSGSITMGIEDRKLKGKIGFDVASKSGMLRLPIEGAEALKLSGGEFSGYYDLNTRTLAVEKFSSAIPNVDSDKPASLNGQITAVLNDGQDAFGTAVNLSLILEGLTVQSMAVYWPKAVGANARDWIVPNITEGFISKATIDLQGFASKDELLTLNVDKLGGMIEIQDTTIHYFRPMPPIVKGKATATYSKSGFDVALEQGELGHIKLAPGRLKITGLDQADQYMDLDANINGPIADKLALVNGEPLQLLKGRKIDPAHVKGDAETNLKITLPLLKDLLFKDVDIQASSKLMAVQLPKTFKDFDLSDGYLDLKVNPSQMELVGVGKIGDSQKYLNYRENFSGEKGLSRIVNLKGFFTIPELEEMGMPPNQMLLGGMDLDLVYQEQVPKANHVKASILADIDLTKTIINIGDMGYEKLADKPGQAKLVINMTDDVVTAIPNFTVSSDGLKASGSLLFNNGRPSQIDMTQFMMPGTDLVFRAKDLGKSKNGVDQGWDADLRGQSFNIKPILKAPPSADDKEKFITRPVNFKMAIANVLINPKSPLKNFKGQMLHDGKVWSHAQLSASSEPGLVDIKIQPQDNKRLLTVLSDDAGGFLKAVDLFDDVKGGSISVSGLIDDTKPAHPVDLDVKMTKFKAVNAPVLAKILSLTSLTGIVDLLKGDGIVFERLKGKIKEESGVIYVSDMEAYGLSLGLNVEGSINTETDQMDLDGTVIPANAINTGLSKIPLIGAILTGTEGEGVFAGKFAVKGNIDDPTVTVNPLSSIAPGILRDFFEAIGGGGSSSAPEPKEPEKPVKK